MDAGLKIMARLMIGLKGVWQGIRGLTGEDAYERYLAHWRQRHGSEGGVPLDRKAFFKQQQERKWNGIKRCC
jgi:uncharacterized short protein YbdD (DUF466 family)